jgi:hypothetical protein
VGKNLFEIVYPIKKENNSGKIHDETRNGKRSKNSTGYFFERIDW